MARKDTNSLHNNGIPLINELYKNHIFKNKKLQLKRATKKDFDNYTEAAKLDKENGIDARILVDGKIVSFQEKVREYNKGRIYDDFTLGIYLNFFAQELWPAEYFKFQLPIHPQYYLTVYLNETQDKIVKWYLTDVDKMMDYATKNYIITTDHVWRCIDKENPGFFDPIEFQDENQEFGVNYTRQFINKKIDKCIEYHKETVYSAKNIRYNKGITDGYSGTSFFGIPWKEMIDNGLVIDYKLEGE